MRTKTLLLTAALTALSSAAVMAQTNVYSLNAVGYINVTVLPGFNMIACQLQTGTNTLGNLIPDSTNAASIGYIDGCTAYKFNGTSYTVDNANSATSSFLNNWTSGGVMTMNPGEAIWFKNKFTTNLTFTFVGTVPQGTLTTTVAGPAVFNMVSSQVPQAGDVCSNLGLTNFNNGDTFYVFNPTNQTYTTYNVNFATGSVGYNQDFLPPGDPIVNVGQGFWYKTGTGGAVTWSRTFSVNQ
jgi:hypothetical protein